MPLSASSNTSTPFATIKQLLHILLIAAAAAVLASCANTTRILQPGERLLTATSFDVAMVDGSEPGPEVEEVLEDKEKYLRQHPRNGLLRFNLSIFNTYFLAYPSDSSWLARTARNLGVKPVVYSPQLTTSTERQLQNLLSAKGCFGSNVVADTQHVARKYVATRYHLRVTPRYRIDDVVYHAADPASQPLVDELAASSLLHSGSYYDQELLVAERERIASELINRGYFLATQQLVRFVVDTSYASGRLSIEAEISNPQAYVDGHTEQRPFQIYYVDTVTFDSNSVSAAAIRRTLTLRPGVRYSPRRTSTSYNALLGLHNFNLINIDYSESPHSTDSLRLLDAHIRLRNSSQQRLSLSLELSNASPIAKDASASGNFGLETVLAYQHRNLFGGAEQLGIEANFLSELNKDVFSNGLSDLKGSFSAFETGLKTSIDLPYFLFPFANKLIRRSLRPHTLLELGADYQYRTYFERIQASASFGYTFNRNRRLQHKIYPLEVAYVRFPMISDGLRQRINNNNSLRLLYQYDDHLIIDSRYELVYTDQAIGQRRNFSYLKASAESAGLLASLLSGITNADNDQYGQRQIAGVQYSQYLRLSGEYKRYFYHGDNSTFVVRAIAGFGLPYGNSEAMPYEKSFFAGGPNNIRAWNIRRLGPGHYNTHAGGTYYYDQAGDITLVLNLEERFPLLGFLEGAIFADCGNVWLYNENEATAGSALKLNTFLSDLALGAGFGLRFKISIITLRLDFATPIYDPTYESNSRWRLKNWHFSQINTNFGIDYPF